MTIGVKPKNSSDLDVGRRPELKSDELFVSTPIVIKILSCEHFFTAEKVLPFIGASVHAAVSDAKNRMAKLFSSRPHRPLVLLLLYAAVNKRVHTYPHGANLGLSWPARLADIQCGAWGTLDESMRRNPGG